MQYNFNSIFSFNDIDKTPKSLDTTSIKSGLSTRSPDELAVHQLRRNLFKLGKNQDQALKGLLTNNLKVDYYFITFKNIDIFNWL